MPSTATDRLQGLNTAVSVKAPCRLKTTANHALSGLAAIDGVTPVAGDRILVGSNTDPIANGIYIAATGAWERALDFNGTLDAVGGTALRVNEGGANADTYWRVSGDGPVVIGTDEIEFEADLLASSSGIAFQQAGTGTVPTDIQSDLRAKGLYPNQWAATGDGVADDTAELQALFTAASVAATPEVHLTGGKTYLITAPGADTIILTLTRGIRIIGNGATIKVAAGSTGFHAIIGSQDAAADLSGLWIEGVIFDHNGANESGNPAVTGSVLNRPRYTVKAKRGAGLGFVNCVVLNAISTNCVHFNGDGNTSDTTVRGSRFHLAEPNGNIYFDHSTLYPTGDNIEVHDNYFENASWGSANGTCAIEVHPGFLYSIKGNRIYKYHTGINVVGAYDTDSRGGVVSGNVMETLRRGISLFSTTYLAHVTGFGLDGLVIDDNEIIVRNQTAFGFMTGGGVGCFGIGFSGGSSLASRNIKIGGGNNLTFDLETTTPDWSGAVPFGVGIGDASGTIVHENFEVGPMLIVNPPAFGMALGGGGGVLKNCAVRGVRIIRPGSTAKSDGALGSADYRTGIWVQSNNVTGSLTINAEIIDDSATTKMVDGMVIQCANAVTVPVNITATVLVTGATTTAYAKAIYKLNDNIVPLISWTQNLSPVTFDSGDTFALGSTTYSIATGVRSEMLTAGGATFTPRVPNYGVTTVAALPAAASTAVGAVAFVTDANATTFNSTVAAGGANKVPVNNDGTNWKIG